MMLDFVSPPPPPPHVMIRDLSTNPLRGDVVYDFKATAVWESGVMRIHSFPAPREYPKPSTDDCQIPQAVRPHSLLHAFHAAGVIQDVAVAD